VAISKIVFTATLLLFNSQILAKGEIELIRVFDKECFIYVERNENIDERFKWVEGDFKMLTIETPLCAREERGGIINQTIVIGTGKFVFGKTEFSLSRDSISINGVILKKCGQASVDKDGKVYDGVSSVSPHEG